MTSGLYRTRPVMVTALEYELDGSNRDAVVAFISPQPAYIEADGVRIFMPSRHPHEGAELHPGDWAVRVHTADVRAVPRAVFELAYDPFTGPAEP